MSRSSPYAVHVDGRSVRVGLGPPRAQHVFPHRLHVQRARGARHVAWTETGFNICSLPLNWPQTTINRQTLNVYLNNDPELLLMNIFIIAATRWRWFNVTRIRGHAFTTTCIIMALISPIQWSTPSLNGQDAQAWRLLPERFLFPVAQRCPNNAFFPGGWIPLQYRT